MPLVQCATCLATINVDEGTDPHSLTWCNCCTIPHHHAEGNAECALDDSHECWHGPASGPRPEGCKVCRPVIHHANANVIFGGPPTGPPPGVLPGSIGAGVNWGG